MTEKLYVTAQFRIKKEKISEAIALMNLLTESTNKNEKGCISYSYIANIDNDSEYTSFEVWENAGAEANHWQMEYVQNALRQLPELLEIPPKVIKWKDIPLSMK